MANRVLVGDHDSLGYGIYVSKPGKDVRSATGIDLIFNSETAYGAGSLHQITDITCASSGTYSGTAAISGLAYIPFVHISEYDNNGVQSIPSFWGRSSGGGSGGGGCLLTGAMIKHPLGETPIEDVREGQKIIGYDTENEKEIETYIVNKSKHLVNSYYKVNDLKITFNHPIWTEKGWACIDPLAYYAECQKYSHVPIVAPKKLELGDLLFNGKVEEIERVNKTAQVWSIGVANTHNYFSNGVLVHNTMNGAAGGRSQIKWSGWRATVTSSQIEIRPWLNSGANQNYMYDHIGIIHDKASGLGWPSAVYTSGKTFRCFVYRIPADG